MRNTVFLFILCFSGTLWAQYVTVDATSYSAQQLIEDILIDSACISDVVVTNSISGDFGGNERSFGYFMSNSSDFPFDQGLVLSTGKLTNVAGPNTSLSDDDAPGWLGDADLEFVLDEQNTTNATLLEFEFTAVAQAVSFRYLFASEEYQQGDPNTCRFSDLFGFLIRPIDDQRYTNIALVPDTQTPVKVTTVHPGIAGGCDPINEAYFDAFNPSDAPINFNGQTTVLTATTTVIPDKRYHVKLVIADEKNHRYDSAVFLEAGSFGLRTDLGGDRLIAVGSALCENQTLQLDATTTSAQSYAWYKDGNLIPTATDALYEVDQEGFYEVVVTLENSCESFGDARIEYEANPMVRDVILKACDADTDGLTTFNLFLAEEEMVFGDRRNEIENFFRTYEAAVNDEFAISNPRNYRNTVVSEIVYARVSNRNGCVSIAQVQLELASLDLDVPLQIFCDQDDDGRTVIDLDEITASFLGQIQLTAPVRYYKSAQDALSDTNVLSSPYQNQTPFFETLFVTIKDEVRCYTLEEVALEIRPAPRLPKDIAITRCTNTSPDGILLESGVSPMTEGLTYSWERDGLSLDQDSSAIQVTEPGTYTLTATAENGCAATRNFEVTVSGIATDISISKEGPNNTTVTVNATGPGDYSFALDRALLFSSNNVFTNLSPGIHTLFVKDNNGCGVQLKEFAIMGLPSFFTPNGDGIHDVFKMAGRTADSPNMVSFQVFDRFGKLLYTESKSNIGWNGTFQGTPLPSGNYWYIMTLADATVFKGHVALIRR